MDYAALSDDELVKECADNAPGPCMALYDRYKTRVYSFGLTLVRNATDAEDVTQDVFRYIFSKLKHYEPKGRFKSFIFKITHSISIDVLRKRSKQTTTSEPIEASYEEVEPERQQQIDQMRQCYARLPRMYREIMALRIMDDFSYEEIAEVLQIPIGTVKSRIHHAVEMLRRMLKDLKEGVGLGKWKVDPEDPTEERA